GETDPVVLAEHFDRGADPSHAVEGYARGAEQSLGGNDWSAAIARAERAIACGAQGERLGLLRLGQAGAYRWERGRARAAVHASFAAQELTRGTVRWFQAVGEALVACARQGRTDLVRLWLESAVRSQPHEGAESAQVDCLCRGAGQLFQA